MTSAAILAGGLGTRLRSVVADRPKVLAPVAGRFFLTYLLDQLADAGFSEVVLCTGYLGEQLEEHFGSRFRRLRLHYSKEAAPLGTGGALRLALPMLGSEPVLVLNGDSYCQVDLAGFVHHHQEKRAKASMVLTQVADVSRYGSVDVDAEGRVRGFGEKARSGAGWINAGIYLLDKDLLARIPPGTPASIERDCFPGWTSEAFFAHRGGKRFLDIGTPESLEQAQVFFAPQGLAGNEGRRRCVLLDRDGTINAERHYLSDPEELELLPGVVAGLKRLRELGLGLVLITNQSAIGRGMFSVARLHEIHDRLRALLGDADLAVDAIYYCPHKPEDDCSCRKPQAGMVDRAVHDLGFDPREAFVIGDKRCDIDMGWRVGATTILVQTGYGEDARGTTPDYTVDGLEEASAAISALQSHGVADAHPGDTPGDGASAEMADGTEQELFEGEAGEAHED